MNRNSLHTALFVAMAILAMIPFVMALDYPGGATDVNEIQSSRFNASIHAPHSIYAQAGNITEINISARSPTKYWQGYYGNITGTIVLEDALGWVFYDWYTAEPKGEIYASTSDSVDWGAIHCFQFEAVDQINTLTEEARYGIDATASDGINETFNSTDNPLFWVGPTTIDAATCPTTWVYRDNVSQREDFVNVLLTDNTSLVYTTIIENKDLGTDVDISGYNGALMDFQLLVAENGGNSTEADTLTLYYFWVELS